MELLGSLRTLETYMVSSPGQNREDGVPGLTLAWLSRALLGTSPPLDPHPNWPWMRVHREPPCSTAHCGPQTPICSDIRASGSLLITGRPLGHEKRPLWAAQALDPLQHLGSPASRQPFSLVEMVPTVCPLPASSSGAEHSWPAKQCQGKAHDVSPSNIQRPHNERCTTRNDVCRTRHCPQ